MELGGRGAIISMFLMGKRGLGVVTNSPKFFSAYEEAEILRE